MVIEFGSHNVIVYHYVSKDGVVTSQELHIKTSCDNKWMQAMWCVCVFCCKYC